MDNFYIALRYLKKKNKFFLTSANMLSLIGIFLGVFALISASSVMNGFRENFLNKMLRTKSEIKLYSADYSPLKNYEKLIQKIENNDYVKTAAPVSYAELILQSEDNLYSSKTFGIDLKKQQKLNNVLDNVVLGDLSEKKFAEDGIILGFDLALNLNVTVGEFVTVSSPISKRITPFGVLPKFKKMQVMAIINTSFSEYDRTFSFINLEKMSYLMEFMPGEITHLEISSHDIHNSGHLIKKLQKIVGEDYIVKHWSEFESNMFNSMRLEKIVMFVVLSLMILLSSFNMTGNFIRLVVQKKTEIGILKALGFTNKEIRKIFVNVGLIVSFIGIFLGFITALAFLIIQQKYHLITLPVQNIPISWLPVKIKFSELVFIPFLVIFITYISTLYPAAKTSKINPIDIIRKKNK